VAAAAKGTPPDDEEQAHRAMAGVAEALRADLAPLTARLDVAVLAAVPALSADADIRLALERSTEANLADILALLADPDVPVDSGVPPEALSLASALVRRGVEPGDLVHAYLVGQNELLRAWMEELADRVPSGRPLIVALELSSARIFTRADFLVAQLMRHIDRERVRWMGGALARRTQVVRGLLEGEEQDVVEASRALGYDIDRWVLAAVLWDTGTSGDPGMRHDRLEAQAAVAARAAGIPRAFTLAAGDAVLWTWLATPEPPDLDAIAGALADSLGEGQGAALGTPAWGLEGFRRGHADAIHARRVAELGGRAGVARYDEVEMVSLVSGDLDRLARFVQRTLGPLTADDDTTARLRQTLLAWLAEGGNARRAAERLHTHKNTVLYRLQRAQLLLGRPLDEDRGALELALSAVRCFGDRVARPAA
jgi:DNA-binding PucR family transcriptional regulator